MTGHLEDWKLVLRVEALSSALQLACQLFLFALYPFSVSGCIQSFARREVQYRTSSWMLTDLGGAATGCGSARVDYGKRSLAKSMEGHLPRRFAVAAKLEVGLARHGEADRLAGQ